jgi:uroporphyrinogen III methyltransferase/synthase
MPKEFLTDRIADALGPLRGQRVLLARSNLARKSLAHRLQKQGAEVELVDAYRTVPRIANVSDIPASSKIDLIVFTSASAVHNLIAILPSELARRLRASAEAACIGPVTAAAARGHGFRIAVTAREHSVAGLVRELKKGGLRG